MSRRVVVIGGGHNGLTAAALLAKHGMKVTVLEAREVVGGAAVTEEFHPGFKASTVAHVLGPIRPSVMRDLDLEARGLKLVEPEPRLFAPTPQGGVVLWGDAGKTAFELRTLSTRDAERYPELNRSLTAIAALVERLLSLTPPDIGAPAKSELWPMASLAMGFRSLGREDAQRLLRWGPMAVADFSHEWFESEILRAILCARGIYGAFAGPWSAGTTANLLLGAAHAGGNAAGHATQVIGGLGSVTAAIAGAARQYGAEIRTGVRVERIVVKDGRASAAVVAGSGEEVAADAVVSAVDPGQTFLRFVDPALFDPDEFTAIRHYRQQGMASKVLFALDGLPAFGSAPPEWLRGRIHVGASVDELERAYDDGKYGRIAGRPWLDITIPSLNDPTLAPAGQHVMSVHVQYTPYRLREGSWDTRRDEVAEVVTRALEEHAPGFTARVRARHVITPLDLERTYGITGGHPFHGEHALDQLFVSRPLLGWSRYRAPIEGLYLCSAGTHPGGGVTAAPAANAAREILKDLG
jgi:phytoene dehydrogenase-like protein